MTPSSDYIIVGGGSAGCVAASQLVREKHVRVLMIERGPARACLPPGRRETRRMATQSGRHRAEEFPGGSAAQPREARGTGDCRVRRAAARAQRARGGGRDIARQAGRTPPGAGCEVPLGLARLRGDAESKKKLKYRCQNRNLPLSL